MKKLLAVLLAFALVGAAVFAESPTIAFAVAGFGEAGVYNNGTDNYAGGNAGWDLDMDVSSEKFGVSAELEWAKPDTMGTNDTATGAPYFNYAYAFWKPFGDMVKINAGNIWITSYRLRNSMLNTMMGGAIGTDGIAVELFPIEGLSLAMVYNVKADKNFTTGAPGYGLLLKDTLSDMDFFAKYAMADVGDFYASVQLGLGSSRVNFGANVKMIENVTLQLGVDYNGLGKSKVAGQDLTVYTVFGYKMDALTLTEEVNVYSNNSTPESKAFGWLSNSIVAYRMGDTRLQATINVKNNRTVETATAKDYILYTAEVAARFYEGSNYFNVAFKYMGNTDDSASAAKATWKLPLSYSIAF